VWSAGHITLAGRPCVSAFPKTILSTCPADAMLKVSNAQRRCKEETWSGGQVTWPAGLTSGPHAPNLWPEHCLAPINTMVLPPAKSVKRVRFAPPLPPRGFQIQSLESRDGGEVLRAGGLPGLSGVLLEALSKSIWVRWSFLSSGLVECGSSARILRIPIESRPSSLSSVLGFRLVGIPTILPRSE
jgi:hypothetical protein